MTCMSDKFCPRGSNISPVTALSQLLCLYQLVQIGQLSGQLNISFSSLLAMLQSTPHRRPNNSCWLCIQDINNILNSGEVPNLMRPEDFEEISGIIRPVLQAQGRAPTKLAIQAAFVDRVQQHLHLVLCMSPVGDAFRWSYTHNCIY